MFTPPAVDAASNGFGSWLQTGKYADYVCANGCGFAYLNSSGLVEYTLQGGTTHMKWQVTGLNSTTASVSVNLVVEGAAVISCSNCSQKPVHFELNETVDIYVNLASNTAYYNKTNIGKNLLWLSTKPLPGDRVDFGPGLTNSGSKVELTAMVANGSLSAWPRTLSLTVFMTNPYIAAFNSYDSDLGYALVLWMPGVPALPDDELQNGILKVGNQTINSIAGFPLAAILHLDFSPGNIFSLTNTNIAPRTSQLSWGNTAEVLAVILGSTAIIATVISVLLHRYRANPRFRPSAICS